MSLDQKQYDVAIFSTGLAQSILSAALTHAGLSVIHLDENDYYADQWASLTLSELRRWSRAQGTGRVRDLVLTFPAYGTSDGIPEALLSLDRHYAISLAPALVPANGLTIDTLIASKVSSYATFRLLEQTAVYSPSLAQSKVAGLAPVPSSKEDIFKAKNLSLVDKRKLMKLLLLIASDDWELDRDAAEHSFVDYLTDVHQLPPELVDAVAYGVALCSTPNDSALAAMTRARTHIKSTGRYGNSAYLVGQYGGAGELAQGFCRASAVKGGVFILNHQIHSAEQCDKGWKVEVAGLDDSITASYLVSSVDLLDKISTSSETHNAGSTAPGRTHRGVLVLDRCIDFRYHNSTTFSKQQVDSADDSAADAVPSETGLIVFPPASIAGNANAVLVLMMGEGTFSCPKGQYVYYIQTEASDEASPTSAVLKPVIDQILLLSSRPGQGADTHTKPLLQLTYLQENCSPAQLVKSDDTLASFAFPPATGINASSSMASLTDAAVLAAQEVYHSILASRLPDAEKSFDERLGLIKQAVLDKKSRRRKRQESEYQGRGGRGSDDGVSRDIEADTGDRGPVADTLLKPDGIIEFFEAASGQEDNDED